MELPFAQISPQDLTSRSCQDLDMLLQPRSQTLEAEETQPSPRALAIKALVSGNLVECSPFICSHPSLGVSQCPEAASSSEGAGKAEDVLGEEGLTLQAETRAWFQKTQAHWLLQHGAAPTWFHGFITRREAERLLETKPQGCFLVRFSESAITFVLTYRSRTCCRHFLLAQLGDGRHVVLGEDSAHARLQDLLRHYTACPLSPYGEKLTEPCARQTPEPAGLSLRTEETDSESKIQNPNPQYSAILKQGQASTPRQKEGTGESKERSQPPRPKPPIPAKPRLSPDVYASPAPRPLPAPPPKPSNPIYQELDEPIAFYAMGRGSPGEAPSNIYAEVEGPSGGEGPQPIVGHLGLRKCRSRPVPGGQNSGGPQLHSENSRTGQVPPLPHQPPPPRVYTLPHNLSKQVLQDQEQTWLPLGPPQ
ncbi:PREDICTED: LOW QUALITY PROTEIN: SH2 domain-containing protein 2A [Chrysochloris asiatica]|uniref:LOW QUALITY PROTEIN: SH2 domain-containing protein 2A n=1 Tax=Chrysochloris asiatica TaxID=185453 RepID=A0A9B0WM74_CHRAS|nr:PREDICTED: LOW QUALITY PROTEIN: SH2 domain-containing protein 2A [Chrysochloris asiatica]